MIVRYSDNGWHVTTQRAHGVLAAQLAMQWKVKNRPERWLETLLAIAEHDDGETEIDGETLITKEGGPLNYSMKSFDAGHCNKASRLSITKSGYIALLISMHMEFLYGKDAKENRAAAAFIKTQRKFQSSIIKHLGLTKAAAKKAYELLQWCDAFSLLIVQESFPPEKRQTDISIGPGNILYRGFISDKNKIIVQPWPFEEDSFKVNYEYRTIEQLQFSSSEVFRKKFLTTSALQKEWQICKL